jgi:hypothetical protein
VFSIELEHFMPIDRDFSENISGDGLLIRYEGKYLGNELLPREVLGPSPSGNVRFWTSYLRVGELFHYKGCWYQVKINKLTGITDSIQSYLFFATPERSILREE